MSGTPRRRSSDRAAGRTTFAIFFLGASLALLLVVVLAFTNRVKDYEAQNRANSIAACIRGNETRVADVKDLRGDVARLRAQVKAEDADIAGLLRSPVQDARWVAAHADTKDALTRGISQKQKAVRDKLAAVEELADGEDPAVVDCERAYPE